MSRRRLVLVAAYALVLYPVLDYWYWHRRGGAFNHH